MILLEGQEAHEDWLLVTQMVDGRMPYLPMERRVVDIQNSVATSHHAEYNKRLDRVDVNVKRIAVATTWCTYSKYNWRSLWNSSTGISKFDELPKRFVHSMG